MHGIDPERLEKLAEACAITFYVLLALAFLCAVFGSPGSAFLLLILGGCGHVARVGLEAAQGLKKAAPTEFRGPVRRSARSGL